MLYVHFTFIGMKNKLLRKIFLVFGLFTTCGHKDTIDYDYSDESYVK